MKKLIALCLSLIMTIMLGSCGTKKSSSDSKKPIGEVEDSSNTPAANTTDTKETQKEAKIVISPPEGWNQNVGSVLPVHYMKNTASFMVKKEPFNSENIDDVVKEAKGIFESTFDGVKYAGEVENITVDGIDARKMIFTCKVSSLQMKYEYVYLFVEGSVYAITFGDIENTFDSLCSDYEKILNDISFD